MKVLIALKSDFDLWLAPAWFSGRLRKEFPGIEVVHLGSETLGGFDTHLQDAEILLDWALRPEQLKAARKLRWIHSPSAAVHQLMYPELVNSDIIVTNGSQVHGAPVAEHVMALILALARNLHRAAYYQARGVWGQRDVWKESPRPREVAGATLGLIGVGSIGQMVARHASALNMRVIAVREHPEKGVLEGVQEVFPTAKLDELLRQSDYVALSVPVTPQTQKMINAQRLAVMKPDACIINVGRGSVIDEPALIEALRAKKIGGAALDVFEEEPLPSDSPFWQLDNVLITPHTAGMTAKAWERQYELFSENLRRYMAGEPMLSVVDKKKGY